MEQAEALEYPPAVHLDDHSLDHHIHALNLAEYQYKLALQLRPHYGVEQKLVAFSYGPFSLGKEDLHLESDQMALATSALQRTTTHALAVVLDTALEQCIPERFEADEETATLARIARVLRNAFSHDPFFPIWRIRNAAIRRVFVVNGVMTIDARDLDGREVDWRHYGGPIAMLLLAQRGRETLEALRSV